MSNRINNVDPDVGYPEEDPRAAFADCLCECGSYVVRRADGSLLSGTLYRNWESANAAANAHNAKLPPVDLSDFTD